MEPAAVQHSRTAPCPREPFVTQWPKRKKQMSKKKKKKTYMCTNIFIWCLWNNNACFIGHYGCVFILLSGLCHVYNYGKIVCVKQNNSFLILKCLTLHLLLLHCSINLSSFMLPMWCSHLTLFLWCVMKVLLFFETNCIDLCKSSFKKRKTTKDSIFFV